MNHVSHKHRSDPHVTCLTSIPSDSYMQQVNANSPSVPHVTRSSPSDPHVQSMTVISPSDPHIHHVTLSAPCNYTCTSCPTSLASYQNVSYKQPTRALRVLQVWGGRAAVNSGRAPQGVGWFSSVWVWSVECWVSGQPEIRRPFSKSSSVSGRAASQDTSVERGVV